MGGVGVGAYLTLSGREVGWGWALINSCFRSLGWALLRGGR